MAKPLFVLVPTSDLGRAQTEVRKFADQLGEVCSGKMIEEVTIGTAETAIPHGLGRIPLSTFAELRADARWWRSKAPDSAFVYLRASASVTATIWIF